MPRQRNPLSRETREAILAKCMDPDLFKHVVDAAIWGNRIDELIDRLHDERPDWSLVKEAWQTIRERDDWTDDQRAALRHFWEVIQGQASKEAAFDKTYAQLERATDKKQMAVEAEINRMNHAREFVRAEEVQRIMRGFMALVVQHFPDPEKISVFRKDVLRMIPRAMTTVEMAKQATEVLPEDKNAP